MNIVWIITAVIFIFSVLNGMRRGLIKTVFSTFTLIAALAIAAYGGPHAAKYLRTTPVYEYMHSSVAQGVSHLLTQGAEAVFGAAPLQTESGATVPDAGFSQGGVDAGFDGETGADAGFDGETGADAGFDGGTGASAGGSALDFGALDALFSDIGSQIEAINALPFPEQIKKGLLDNNNYQIYDALGVSSFTQYITDYVCMIALNAASYVGLFIVAYVIIRLVGLMLNRLTKFPVLRGLNRTAGLILGALNGVMAVWFMFVVITLFCTSGWGSEALRQISENPFLSYLYNHNYLLTVIKDIGLFLF